MNEKQRVHAALSGQAVDRYPVTVLYSQLYNRDHFAELTDESQWHVWVWQCAPPDRYLALYSRMVEKAPFEVLQPDVAPPRDVRENTTFIEQDGKHFRLNKKDGTLTELPAPVSGHAFDERANETQYVFDKRDADEQVQVKRAEQIIASGANDYLEAAVTRFGQEHFILSGGVVGVVYSCSWYVGLTNLYALLIEKPALIEYLSHKILEQNVETIRQLAAAGGDAIYIDDAMTTCDMISVKHYERFSLPYMQEMVREIHRQGQKAIVIYFGGIADRLEQIASIGADGLQMETSMKGYINDIGETVRKIGDRVTVFGNLDPLGMLQNATDEKLEAEMKRQIAAGRQGRGFISCTGSPITPATPLARVLKFLELGRKWGAV
jgi:uroporphyrinogen decarboxylase